MSKTPTTDATPLDEAFSLLCAAYRAGGFFEIERAGVLLCGHPDAADAVSDERLRALAAPLRELVAGPRRDWAKDRTEAVVAVRGSGDRIVEVAVVLLHERRVLGKGLVLGAPGRGELRALAELCAGADGIVAADPTPEERALVGLLLSEAEIGRGKLEIVEVAGRKGSGDYRDFLAGSFWIDMAPPAESDPVGRALMAALQVRSIRQQALKSVKQGFYTAAAARMLSALGGDVDAIRKRLKVPASLVGVWLEAAEAAKPARRGPTENQLRFAEDILADIPGLEACLPPDWREDGNAVRAFLARLAPHQQGWRHEARELRQGLALRRRLGAGATLGDLVRETGITREGLVACLDWDPAPRLAAIEAAMAEVMARPVPLEPSAS